MFGFYFTDVASESFTGVTQEIVPPRSQHEWHALLKKHNHNHRQHRNHNDDDNAPVTAELSDPMTDPAKLHKIIDDSESYEDKKPNDAAPNLKQCTPQHAWQVMSFPACNTVHEHTLAGDRFLTKVGHGYHKIHRHHLPPLSPSHHRRFRHGHQEKGDETETRRRRLLETTTDHLVESFKFLAHGHWRDTWKLHDNGGQAEEPIAFKTLRYQHDATEYVMDKQRRDSITSDRLSFSPQAIDMYASCGTSALYEFAPGGDLKEMIQSFRTPKAWTEYFSSHERYRLAHNVTAALADLHQTEGRNQPTAIVHGDFKSDQFVAVTQADNSNNTQSQKRKLPHYKLGDFNLARFVFWNQRGQHPCVIHTDGNGDKNRAPEEYSKDKGQTEKVDVYRYVCLTHFKDNRCL